jgi:hypothetical protein
MRATTLVAVWAPDQLLIGADSAVVTEAGVKASACKIAEEGSTFYAFSGLVEDQSVGYEIAPVAEQAIAEGASLPDRIARFMTAVRGPLIKSLGELKRDSPDQYVWLEQGHPVLQAIFADNSQNPPALAIAGFGVSPDGQLMDFTRTIAQGDDGRGPRIIYAGQQTKIREYLHEHPDWYRGDRSALVRNLIQMEIDGSTGGQVGAPIDIIAIQPNGSHWIQKKPACTGLIALR